MLKGRNKGLILLSKGKIEQFWLQKGELGKMPTTRDLGKGFSCFCPNQIENTEKHTSTWVIFAAKNLHTEGIKD